MKTFDELYAMYTNGDDNIAIELFSGVDFNELYKECNKHLAKYYEFKNWLEYAEDYFNMMLAEDAAFLKEE